MRFRASSMKMCIRDRYNDVTNLINQRMQLEEYNRAMHKLAYTDEVTAGYNRRRFEQIAEDAIASFPAGTFVLVWMNLQKMCIRDSVYRG